MRIAFVTTWVATAWLASVGAVAAASVQGSAPHGSEAAGKRGLCAGNRGHRPGGHVRKRCRKMPSLNASATSQGGKSDSAHATDNSRLDASSGLVPPAPDYIFAPDGVWTAALPADAPIDPRSGALVDRLAATVKQEAASGTGPALSARARTPVYRAGPDVPRVPVKLDSGPWADGLKQELANGVPIPPDAQPSSGSDGMMVVWQPSSDTYWEFFLMQQALHFPQFVGAPQVSDSGEVPAGSYAYKVTALNHRGETNAKVGGLPVTVQSDGSEVSFRWAEIEGATGYRIYRGPSADDVGQLATVPAGTTSFTDRGKLQPSGRPPPTTNTAATPGEWRAAYGGVIHHASANPGYYRNVVHGAENYLERFDWGASATSLPLAPGLVTKQDLDRGRIDHALSIGLPNLTPQTSLIASGQWAFPAQRSDGRSTLPDAIPEGARLRLDPSLDLGSLHLSPFIRMLAEAAQRYGMIVQGGSEAVVVYGQDPSPYERAGKRNFYAPQLGSSQPPAFLADFPWAHLEVVKAALCGDSTRPCTERGQG